MNYISHFSTYRTGILQARAYRNLRHFMDTTLIKHSLSCMDWSILGVVHEETINGGIRVSALAKLLDVQTAFVTNMISKLQKNGYVKHMFDEDDGRVRLIVATEKGHLKVIEIEATLRQDMRAWLGEIEPTSLATYISVLDEISKK